MSASAAPKTLLDKEEARKLIEELQDHQAREIECLRKLHGLSNDGTDNQAKTDGYVSVDPEYNLDDESLYVTFAEPPLQLDRAKLEEYKPQIRRYFNRDGELGETSKWILDKIFQNSQDTWLGTFQATYINKIHKDDISKNVLPPNSTEEAPPLYHCGLYTNEIRKFTQANLATLLGIEDKSFWDEDDNLLRINIRMLSRVLKSHLNKVGDLPEVDFQYHFGSYFFSFRLPFFEITHGYPSIPSNVTPLAECGVFGGWLGNKFIRQRQFSIAFYGRPIILGSSAKWKLISLTPEVTRARFKKGFFSLWVIHNLEAIVRRFQTVLAELDRQISIDSTIIFKEEERNKLLFEDENFSNSKKYFWALQSLRVFLGIVSHTREVLPQIFNGFEAFDENLPKGWKEKSLKNITLNYEMLEKRIEQKRIQIEGLSNGLFSASSVIEARLAANQNQNIRLLTLVTIAFLPISFVASIFSMSVLPESTTLGSFFATTVIMTLVTFIIVFNLRNFDRTLYKAYGDLAKDIQRSMIEDSEENWKKKGTFLKQSEQLKRAETPVSNWWYVWYLFHNPRFLLQRLRRKEPKDRSEDCELEPRTDPS